MSDALQGFLSYTGGEENIPMKVRIIVIFMLSCLGLIAPVQATGARSSLGDGLPIQERTPDRDLVEDLSTFIPAQMQAAKVPGLSIALIQEGEILWVEGFGETNSITGKPVAGDTVFEAASISKAIAAYAALALVERGVLSLDEPVHNYLSRPWLPPSAYAEQITLRQLLTHTSGLTNQVNPVDKSIIFPPGERYEYSGVGFIYLQEVMEQVTGKSLEQIAQELVFEPLEMDSSSYVNTPKIMPRLAYGHINYGIFTPLVLVLAVTFTLPLLVWLIVRRIRLGKFALSGKMLWISYMIAAIITLALVIFVVVGEVNKWVTLTALWLILFGGGMILLLFVGRKLIARLSAKWQKPRNRVALLVLWSFIIVLALLLLTNALNGPIPRSPAGPSSAAYSLRTTAPDLAKFLLELTSPQHLDPALVAEMTSPQVQSDKNQSWGLGIGLLHTSQGTVLWHSGDNLDFHALMAIDQEQKNGVVLLTNGQNGGALVNQIATRALGIDFGQE
jgi:CubicO group peptidase (beta-lactamase class C family)